MTVSAISATVLDMIGARTKTGRHRQAREEGEPMPVAMVLNEDEALELVAFLVTAARAQVDEAAEYGSLRLLTAARRLADPTVDRVSSETRAFLTGPLQQMPDLAVRTADPAGYVTAFDAVCRAMGEHLVAHFGLDRAKP